MIIDRVSKAIKLLTCFGEINDYFLEEAESEDIAAIISSQNRLARYGKLAAAASFGIAVTYLLLRSRRAVDVKKVMKKSA